jgi:hypothetical protein
MSGLLEAGRFGELCPTRPGTPADGTSSAKFAALFTFHVRKYGCDDITRNLANSKSGVLHGNRKEECRIRSHHRFEKTFHPFISAVSSLSSNIRRLSTLTINHDRLGQQESRRDQPNKSRESHKRNQEKSLWKNQVKPTQLTSNCQKKSECN